MTDHHARRAALVITAALFIISLIFYTLTLAPSVVTLFDDSLEFQLVTYQLGIAHPTGYPLYTLLGKLFTLLPLGNVAYRVNWMSAVFGAATVALTYRLILRLAHSPGDTRAWPAHLGASFGALLLAVGPVFWRQATIAEVYTLNALFVALLLFVAVSLPPLTQGPRGLYLLAFLSGLSLTHHRTMLLLLPALALYLLLTCPRRVLLRPQTIGLSLLAGALPLLLYLYLPLRGDVGSLDGSYQNTWAGFWQQVTASGYNTFIFANPFGHQRDLLFYWDLLVGQFYTILPGVAGLIYLWRPNRRAVLALTGVAFVTYVTFNLFYNVTDIDVFFIPVFLIWAVWSGLGAVYLLRLAAVFPRTGWRRPLLALLLLLFGWNLGLVFARSYADIRQAYSWAIHDYGIDMLRQPLPNNAAVVGIVGEMTLLRYFQQTEGLRPDVQTVAADDEAARLAAVAQLLQAGNAVYLTRQLPGAAERWSLSAAGPLIRVQPPAAETLPPLATPLNQPVTPVLSLRGYEVSRAPHTGAGPAPLRLTLAWQAVAPQAADLKVSARLLDATGQVVAVTDAAPVHFAYPTSRWRAGEIVTDVYDLPLPLDLPAGAYTPLLIWYNPAQNAAEVGRVALPPITLR